MITLRPLRSLRLKIFRRQGTAAILTNRLLYFNPSDEPTSSFSICSMVPPLVSGMRYKAKKNCSSVIQPKNANAGKTVTGRTSTLFRQFGKRFSRVAVALIRRFLVEFSSFGRISRNAFAFQIAFSKLALGFSIALIRCLRIPLDSRRFIFSNAVSILVRVAELALSLGVSLLSGFRPPLDGFSLISVNAVSFVVAVRRRQTKSLKRVY